MRVFYQRPSGNQYFPDNRLEGSLEPGRPRPGQTARGRAVSNHPRRRGGVRRPGGRAYLFRPSKGGQRGSHPSKAEFWRARFHPRRTGGQFFQTLEKNGRNFPIIGKNGAEFSNVWKNQRGRRASRARTISSGTRREPNPTPSLTSGFATPWKSDPPVATRSRSRARAI